MKFNKNTFKKFLRTALSLVCKGVSFVDFCKDTYEIPRVCITYANNTGVFTVTHIHGYKTIVIKEDARPSATANAVLLAQLERLVGYWVCMLEQADTTTLLCLAGVEMFLVQAGKTMTRSREAVLSVIRQHLEV